MRENKRDRDQITRAVADCLDKIDRYRKKQQIDDLREKIKSETDAAKKTELLSLLTQLMNEPGAARKL